MIYTFPGKLASVLMLVIVSLAGACATSPPVAASDPVASTVRIVPDIRARVAIATAYGPEFRVLLPLLDQPEEHRIQGVSYWTGELSGQSVVLFKTGVSIVNATMNTQRLVDEFNITHIVVSGVAGSIDPDLSIGDVIVPERWAKYDEATYLREIGPDVFKAPFPGVAPMAPPFGFMGTRGVRIATPEDPAPEPRLWFSADPGLLKIAAAASSAAELTRCDEQSLCLPSEPVIRIGGAGLSGSVFMDNRTFRDYLHETFDAQVVEMETAAIAMVAYANGIPFIAFRSVSDLAGGGEASQNEIRAFEHLAAQNSAALVSAFLRQLSSPASSGTD
nr:5'-methylthioadenosine/S-adenosylhomocysteine nucleosidase [uncultured Hyphomonas sp.]